MIYKVNIREIFGSRSGGKGAYIYELAVMQDSAVRTRRKIRLEISGNATETKNIIYLIIRS